MVTPYHNLSVCVLSLKLYIMTYY